MWLIFVSAFDGPAMAMVLHSSIIRAGLNLGCENNCSGYFSVIKIMVVSRQSYLSLASYSDPETSVLAFDVVATRHFIKCHSAECRWSKLSFKAKNQPLRLFHYIKLLAQFP